MALTGCCYLASAVTAVILAVFLVPFFDGGTLSWPQQLESDFLPSDKLRGSQKMNAFVIGATGEVGKALIRELATAEAFNRVTLLTRRKLELPLQAGDAGDYSKFEQQIIDFEKLKTHATEFQGYDVGFCALGTTRGKAGADGFVRVDHDYVVESARLAKDGGCKHFNLVSSQGANKNAWFLYTRVKGQVEEEVKTMNFDRLSIWEPGVLLVDRTESRPLEKLAQMFLKPLDFCRYVSTDVPLLARTMVQNAMHSDKSGVHVYTNRDIYNLAKVYSSK